MTAISPLTVNVHMRDRPFLTVLAEVPFHIPRRDSQTWFSSTTFKVLLISVSPLLLNFYHILKTCQNMLFRSDLIPAGSLRVHLNYYGNHWPYRIYTCNSKYGVAFSCCVWAYPLPAGAPQARVLTFPSLKKLIQFGRLPTYTVSWLLFFRFGGFNLEYAPRESSHRTR